MFSKKYFEIRIKIAFTLAFASILYNVYYMYQQHSNIMLNWENFINENKGKNYISMYESRFDEIRKYVTKPSSFFYIAEENTSQYRSPTEAYHYVMSQYHFAPNILYYNEKDKNCCNKILYNKYNVLQLENDNSYLKAGWIIEKDFKNGLIILAKP